MREIRRHRSLAWFLLAYWMREVAHFYLLAGGAWLLTRSRAAT